MRLGPFLILALAARITEAQADSAHLSGTTVSGIVHDSIARAPLAGAMVQLVASDSPARFLRAGVSDSLGRFIIGDVPEGRYTLGFFHPMLDSLGIEPPLRQLQVNGLKPVRSDLAIPSAERLRAAICQESSPAKSREKASLKSTNKSTAVVVGVVRDARDGTPQAGVTVAGEWLEVSVGADGVVPRIPHIITTTWENGWFAMCDVPKSGTMFLIASRGADSTDLVEIQLPPSGFLRRELFIGAARNSSAGDGAQSAGASSVIPVHTGDGHLSGTVLTATDGRPIIGAQVSIANGPQTRSNEHGEWMLADAPVGTRMIEVRALGYYPERRRVDVVTDAPSVRVALSTLESVLDTVRVTARRPDRGSNGFERRRRTGIGRFFNAEELARKQPTVTSDILRSVAGIKMDFARGAENHITMRGALGDCEPTIFINGLPMTTVLGRTVVTLSADDLDTWVRPKDITAMEIYTGDTVPIEYQQAQSGCGSILIWTKMRR